MANTNAPFGFRYIGLLDGSPPNLGIYTGQLTQNYGTAIYTGDALLPISGGNFALATVTGNTGAATGGIALGFSWLSKAFGCRIWRPYWPASGDANSVIEVKVANHPDAIFEVQALLGPITQASVGEAINFSNVGTGNTFSGISGMSADDGTITTSSATLPFAIYQVPGTSIPIGNLDPSSAYNVIKVRFNNLTRA